MKRASSSFASSGSSAAGSSSDSMHEPVVLRQQLVRDPHRLAELLFGRVGEPDVVAERGAHLLRRRARAGAASSAPPAARGRRPAYVAAGEQVVELVGAAQLDVGLDRDRVVGLHERVEELRDRDRRSAPRSASAKSSRSSSRATVIVRVRRTTSAKSSFDEPLAVEAHLEPLRARVDDLRRLLEVRLSRSRRSPRPRGSVARSSGPTGRRSASCSRR